MIAEHTVYLPRLHPGQARIVAQAKRFNVVMCGRRFGKTTLGIERASQTALDGKAVGWFAPTNKYMYDVWDELVKRLAPIANVRKQENKIDLITGGKIEMWSFEIDGAGRSRGYDLVIVDEVGLVRDFEKRWTEDVRPTLSVSKGPAWFLGTPRGASSYFAKLFGYGQGEPDWMSCRVGSAENPLISADEVEHARRSMPDAAFRQEWLGEPSDDGGNPFGLAAIRACIGPLSALEPQVYGIDIARAQDYTVAIGLDHHRKVCRVERFQEPWPLTLTRLHALVGSIPCLVDSTGVGDAFVPFMQQAGIRAEGYHFTLPSKQHLMERLVHVIQHRETTFPDGPVVAELETFGFEYRPSGVRYSAPEGLHDDCVMALALAHCGADRIGVRPPVVKAPETLDPWLSSGRDQDLERLQRLAQRGIRVQRDDNPNDGGQHLGW